MDAKNLDREVRDYLISSRQLQKHSSAYFERLLRRARGLIELSRNGFVLDEIWNIEEILQEAESLLFVVRRLPNSPLFAEVSRLGRLQQLESITIEAEKRIKGNISEAAHIGMRMLVEDEYIDGSAFECAACTLASFLRETNPPNTAALRLHLQDMLKSRNTRCPDRVKRVVFLII